MGLKRGESRWRNREGRERKELKLEREIGGGIKYIYIFRILLQYNSKFRIVL